MGKRWTKSWLWKFGRSVRGNAAAEFALCIPLLIIIMVAIIEMGRGMHDLDVEVTENSVILHGRAPSYYVKQLAQAAAMRMQRRSKLVNEIVVDSSTAAFQRA